MSLKQVKTDLPENQGLSPESLQQLIHQAMRFKERSSNTCHTVHLPELILQSPTSNASAVTSIETVLIGDSMLERLKTTGISTDLAQLQDSFNAGCGGDKIENVLYRLSFMYPYLEQHPIKLWVVMVGTNNLRKKGLRPSDVELYRLLLQVLLMIAPRSKVLACEIFRRKDIEDHCVDEANGMLKRMIDEMNVNLKEERVIWSDAPAQVTKEELDDHVHLDAEGYRLWDETLYSRILEILRPCTEKSTSSFQ
ncbi:hypothetical protein BGX28_000631 [Mortierella sp. GBA30]|nr:hypothetical protein BGX28_000631 [Mortierella sp. GBA30]